MKPFKTCIIFSLLFLFSNAPLHAQTEQTEMKKKTFGMHIATYDEFFRIGSGIEFGMEYSAKWNKRWAFGSGIDFLFESDFNEPLVISIPFLFKYNFNKYIYANFGPYLTAAFDESSFPLYLGAKIGVGLEYEFKNGLVLSLNPYARFASIFGTGGISLGVGYRF